MIGAPLVTDSRLEQAEVVVRREFPGLPEGAEFVTYAQEPRAIEDGGITVPVPEVAVCGIVMPHPARKDIRHFVSAGMWMHEWRQREKDKERLVGVADPLLMALRAAAKDAVVWYRAAKGMN